MQKKIITDKISSVRENYTNLIDSLPCNDLIRFWCLLFFVTLHFLINKTWNHTITNNNPMTKIPSCFIAPQMGTDEAIIRRRKQSNFSDSVLKMPWRNDYPYYLGSFFLKNWVKAIKNSMSNVWTVECIIKA